MLPDVVAQWPLPATPDFFRSFVGAKVRKHATAHCSLTLTDNAGRFLPVT